MTTRAKFYEQRNGGKWRTARVPHLCDWKYNGIRCRVHINPGDQYFDTGLPNPQSSNEHGTHRICDGCANMEIL